jgi:hypothetical protein
MKRPLISGPGLRIFAAAVGVLICAPLAAQSPARTPTPAPRLSGGFGRPRATALPTPAIDEGGQALSDVVHAARGAGVRPAEKSGLTINNRSLVKDVEKGRVSSSSRPAPTSSPRPLPANSPTAAAASAAEAPATGGTEAEWRQTAAATRKRVAEGRARVAELEAATKKLESDFYAWDDGQYRDRVIKPAWDRSRSELETAKQELLAAERDLADLPERARKAGAQPGWIRE